MRSLLSTPIVLLLGGAIGYAICTVAGWRPHLHDAAFAVAIAMVATAAAVIPLFLARRSDQNALAQAGLVALMVHLFTATALAGGMILIAKPPMAFTYWLFAFYWMTLILVATSAVRLIKAAPMTRSVTKQ